MSATDSTLADRGRALLESESTGTLATLSSRHAGWPFASLMPYAVHDGAPIFLISGMAVHTQNLITDARASLLVAQSGGDPFNSPRGTFLGTVRRVDEPEDGMRAVYVKRHPSAKQWIGFSDFAFFRMEVTSIYFVGGFGVMGWITP